jgi:hypothetical protein
VTLHLAYPLTQCYTAFLVFNSFYPVTFASTALLFFFRVRAVCGATWRINGVFGFLWVGILASSMTIPFGGKAARIGPTGGCIVTRLAPYVTSSGIICAIYDSAVFLTISCRLISNNSDAQSRLSQLKAIVSNPRLPAFSKALFNDGQKYYL